jgi:hypothetical protein
MIPRKLDHRSQTPLFEQTAAEIRGCRGACDVARLAHRNGYPLDELIEVIQTVG